MEQGSISPFATDSVRVADFSLCELRLYDDADLLWLLLVPKKDHVVELTDLAFADQVKLLEEINFIAKLIKNNFPCDKLNIASLGNKVPALHVHIIARRHDDPYFPDAPFGKLRRAYLPEAREERVKQIQELIHATTACA